MPCGRGCGIGDAMLTQKVKGQALHTNSNTVNTWQHVTACAPLYILLMDTLTLTDPFWIPSLAVGLLDHSLLFRRARRQRRRRRPPP